MYNECEKNDALTTVPYYCMYTFVSDDNVTTNDVGGFVVLRTHEDLVGPVTEIRGTGASDELALETTTLDKGGTNVSTPNDENKALLAKA